MPRLRAEDSSARADVTRRVRRLALVVSHPIQYYVPLYRRLARRKDIVSRVFYTWHGGREEVWDSGFNKRIAWDIPLTDGYDYEVIANQSRDPGTHHFCGLRNKGLLAAVTAWEPDALHLTGYAYASHLSILRAMHGRGVPVLFRGDSHVLDSTPLWKAFAKKALLRRVFRYPAAFLCVGTNNRDYYRCYGVPEEKLFSCPHSIEFERFAEPASAFERQAVAWRRSLGIGDRHVVLLFAGKFERKKQPAAMMRAVAGMKRGDIVMLMVGDGELNDAVKKVARQHPRVFKTLPFQNQSMMPVVYRLGDVFVLPSAYGETWGLAVNEAMACGRPVLVSDRVGCGVDMVAPGVTGERFRSGDWRDFAEKVSCLAADRVALKRMGAAARGVASQFTIEATEAGLVAALESVLSAKRLGQLGERRGSDDAGL